MKYAMALVLAAMVSSAHAMARGKDADSPAKRIYVKKCSSCHGADGKGKAPMAKMFKVKPEDMDLTAKQVAAKKDDELVSLINAGKGRMPAFKEFKDGETVVEAAAVVAYIRSLAPAPAAVPAAK